jgi:mycothiol synthase
MNPGMRLNVLSRHLVGGAPAGASSFERVDKRLPQLFMHRRTLDELPDLNVPAGYSVRTYREGDAGHWCAILNDTSGMGEWVGPEAEQRLINNGPFGDMRELSANHGLDGKFEPSNLFFVEDPSGEPCATACAWTKQTSHGLVGELHMVSVKPGHRGKRLGHVVTAVVLHRFKELGFISAHLGTDDWRVAAIRSYWGCGYEAEISHWSHNARWAALEKFRDSDLSAPNIPAPPGMIE